jgi:hypothetical protein
VGSHNETTGLTHRQDVAMILLQILDEGSITDSQGRKVDFKVMREVIITSKHRTHTPSQNTIICLTSNLGMGCLTDVLISKYLTTEQEVISSPTQPLAMPMALSTKTPSNKSWIGHRNISHPNYSTVSIQYSSSISCRESPFWRWSHSVSMMWRRD